MTRVDVKVIFSSTIFHTKNIDKIRTFYLDKLGLKVGQYEKDGVFVPDESDNYVNFDLDGILLCFEREGERCDLGTVVLHLSNFTEKVIELETATVQFIKKSANFVIFADPDGREIILEPISKK